MLKKLTALFLLLTTVISIFVGCSTDNSEDDIVKDTDSESVKQESNNNTEDDTKESTEEMENQTPVIKRGTPTLDGKLDDLYLDSYCIHEKPMEHMNFAFLGRDIAQIYMENTWAKAYYLYDDKYLYVCTVVHDETLCTRGKEWRMNTVWPWNDDGAEIYVWFSNEDCFAVHNDAHGYRSVVDEHISDAKRTSNRTYHDTPREDWATSIDKENNNYVIELRILLPDYVKPGSTIGTLIEINDRWTAENDPNETMVGALFQTPQYPGDPKFFIKLED